MSASMALADQDCRVMEKKDDGISLGFKFGGFGWGVGPEIGFHNKSGIDWHDNIQYMIAEYQELCSRFNTGRISETEYQKEINNIISRSRGYSKEMYLHFEKKKQKFFNEMENFNQGDLQ
jgi:hypothetical protein